MVREENASKLSEERAPAAFIACPIMLLHEGVLHPAMQDSYRDTPQLGTLLLLGYLKQAGKACDLIDWVAQHDLSIDQIAQRASAYDVIFFSANSMNWGTVLMLAKKIRAHNRDARICVGGPHPTQFPNSVASSGVISALFRGEADRAMVPIYEVLVENTPHTIPGFAWCDDRSEQHPPTIVQADPLDALAWRPAYDQIAPQKYFVVPVETSRGCKFVCDFCSIIGKRNWRPYSAQNAINNILLAESHLGRVKNRQISIIDNTFTTDHERTLAICKALPETRFKNMLIYDATVVDLRNERLVETLAPYTSDLLVGAEVSNKADAKRIRKAATPQLILEAAGVLKKYAISERSVFSFIIGFPWHTVEDCLRTVRFATNLILDYGVCVYLQWYWPMPGSPLWDELERSGRVGIDVVETPGFYNTAQWFYGVRDLNPDDVACVDKAIVPLQLLLNLHGVEGRRAALSYSPPIMAEDDVWRSHRMPLSDTG